MKQKAIWVGVGAVLLLFAAKCQYDNALRKEGSRAVVEQQTVVQRDSIARLLSALASARRVDTVILRQAVVRRQPIADTVTRWLTDTVPVPVEIVKQIVVADSQVIAACRSVVSTCEAETSLLREDLRLSERQTALWKAKAQPSWWAQLGNAGKWLAVGYVLGRVY